MCTLKFNVFKDYLEKRGIFICNSIYYAYCAFKKKVWHALTVPVVSVISAEINLFKCIKLQFLSTCALRLAETKKIRYSCHISFTIQREEISKQKYWEENVPDSSAVFGATDKFPYPEWRVYTADTFYSK